MRSRPAIDLAYAASPSDAQSRLPGAALLALGTIAIILIVYRSSAWSMLSIWLGSQTFAHGILIFPISAYLIWMRRDHLATLSPRSNPFALAVLAVLGLGWLLATLSGVRVFEQYFLVAMIPVVVWAVLGTEIVRAIAFPLFYLLLAVPFGDVLIAPLIEFTASFTVHALQLTGIPVYREGSYFSLPSGNWSVIEACSGLRYLIASLTLGTLFAYLTYHSIKRRLAFILLAGIVPIIANGIRAYLIVMIGHLSDMRLAVGVDHLVYGWFFFGLVMLMLGAIGMAFRENESDKPISQSSSKTPGAEAPLGAHALMAVACIALALVWPAVAAYLDNPAASSQVGDIRIDEMSGDWKSSHTGLPNWKPRYIGSPQIFFNSYQSDGRLTHLHIAYYPAQAEGAELISSGNVLVPENDPQWRNIGETARGVSLGSRSFATTQNQLHSSSTKLLVWKWYWIDGEVTTSPYLAKIILAKNKLLGKSNAGAEIIVAATYEEKPDEASAVLQGFLDSMMPAIEKGLRDAAGNEG